MAIFVFSGFLYVSIRMSGIFSAGTGREMISDGYMQSIVIYNLGVGCNGPFYVKSTFLLGVDNTGKFKNNIL